MRNSFRKAFLVIALIAMATGAKAQAFSTSAINPSPVAANGVIAGNFPATDAETSYYFSVDLKAGELVTQMSLVGRPGRDKYLEFDLKVPKGRAISYYRIMESLNANQEATRIFPVDSSGTYQIVLKTKGPETTAFQVDIGGTALPTKTVATSTTPSRSFLAPAPLPKSGLITGTAPGGDKKVTYYYFATNLKAGDLLTQISFAGRPNAPKTLEFAVLDAQGRAGANSGYYIMSELSANEEKTRAFAIDSSGRYVVRIGISGVEGTQYKVELGGSAFPAN